MHDKQESGLRFCNKWTDGCFLDFDWSFTKMPPVDGIWGTPTSTIDWCEENYHVTPLIAEFCKSTYSSIHWNLLKFIQSYKQIAYILCITRLCAVTVQFCRFVEKYEFNSVKIIDIALVLMYMYRLINLCINTYAKGSNLLFLPLILVLLKKYTTNCNIDIFYVIHIKNVGCLKIQCNDGG